MLWLACIHHPSKDPLHHLHGWVGARHCLFFGALEIREMIFLPSNFQVSAPTNDMKKLSLVLVFTATGSHYAVMICIQVVVMCDLDT